MIPLPGHDLDCLVHLLSILIIVISLKAGDLTSEFGFDDGYCDLSPVCDVQSWDTSPSTRFFEAATQLTLCPDFAVPFPQEWRKECLRGGLT
jgi:hypothetical protein